MIPRVCTDQEKTQTNTTLEYGLAILNCALDGILERYSERITGRRNEEVRCTVPPLFAFLYLFRVCVLA